MTRNKAILIVLLTFAGAVLSLWFGQIGAGMLLGRLPASLSESGAWVEWIYAIIIFAPVLVIAKFGALLDQRSLFSVGEKPSFWSAVGLGLGCVGVGIAVVYARLSGGLELSSSVAPVSILLLLSGFAAILFQSGSEEIFFRGWLQPLLGRVWSPVVSVCVTAILFMALHIVGGARSPITLVNLFLGGLWFGLLALRSGGLPGAIAAHFGWNATEQLVVGLVPNPGISGFGAIYDLELVGRPIWGGSEEGLNASIAITTILIAMIIPLVWRARATDHSGPAPRQSGPVPG
jgi:uncharacterized protein